MQAEGKDLILVVDDDQNSVELITSLLQYTGYEAISANDGEDGIAKFQKYKDRILLVLMDVIMPGIDGFEASIRIKEIIKEEYIPIIFITSLSKKSEMVRALTLGDDIITKPFNHELLSAKVRIHSKIVSLNQQLHEKNKLLIKHQEKIDMERDVTERVFDNFMSKGVFDSPEVNAYSSPQAQFSGDVLLVIPSISGKLFFFMGDVTGHGLPAAVCAVPASCAFQTMSKKDCEISDIAREMNRCAAIVLPSHMMMAGIIGCLYPCRSKLELWMGGIPDAIQLDEERKVVKTISSWHMPLGVLEDKEFSTTTKVFDIPGNHKIVMYTDGISETRNIKDEMFGDERVCRACEQGGESPFSNLLNEVNQFRSNSEQTDDVTLLELSFSGYE